MRNIGTCELRMHLSDVLDAVEHGQTIVVTRHGRRIARISPESRAKNEQVKQAVKALMSFQRTPPPRGITVRSLIR